VVIVFGRRKPPRKLRPKLERSERVLAWARTAEDPSLIVVVTTFGLWLPSRGRLGWHEIHKATWTGSRLTVVPSTQVGQSAADGRDLSYTVMADDAPIPVQLGDPGDVPHEVRQRVTRSVAFTAHHAVPGGGVRVVARRVAGRDGVLWHVRYDDGTDAADPAVAAATAELVAEAAGPGRPTEAGAET
jgi:hypothetical protein